jgi:hypothetical protein
MKRTGFLWFLIALATAAMVQAQARIEIEQVGKYCSQVETFASSHQPRIFAQTGASEWGEFSSPAEWKRAGTPTPLALAWKQDGNVVRVAITTENSAEPQQPYSDYCYRADGSLAMLRSMPERRVDCDAAHFQCHITLRGVQQLYTKHGRPAKGNLRGQDVADMPASLDPRPLKSEQTSVTLDLKMPPQYLTVSDLPFHALLLTPSQ